MKKLYVKARCRRLLWEFGLYNYPHREPLVESVMVAYPTPITPVKSTDTPGADDSFFLEMKP